MTPHRALAPYDWPALLALIRAEFSGMEGRIDPPSSMHRLTAETIAEQATKAEVWVIGTPPRACVFLTPKADALYIGKLAVAADASRSGSRPRPDLLRRNPRPWPRPVLVRA